MMSVLNEDTYDEVNALLRELALEEMDMTPPTKRVFIGSGEDCIFLPYFPSNNEHVSYE